MGTRINFTPSQAAALYAAVCDGIDGRDNLSPGLESALDRLERNDRPTFTDYELAALYREVLNAVDDYPTIPAALDAAIDKLEAAR